MGCRRMAIVEFSIQLVKLSVASNSMEADSIHSCGRNNVLTLWPELPCNTAPGDLCRATLRKYPDGCGTAVEDQPTLDS